MRVHAHGVQYSVRGVPPEVDRLLREKASQKRVSLNQLVVDELTRATVGTSTKADFSDLVGKWHPDAGFDEIVEANRRVDRKEWR
jgi:hypothetical protein